MLHLGYYSLLEEPIYKDLVVFQKLIVTQLLMLPFQEIELLVMLAQVVLVQVMLVQAMLVQVELEMSIQLQVMVMVAIMLLVSLLIFYLQLLVLVVVWLFKPLPQYSHYPSNYDLNIYYHPYPKLFHRQLT